MTSSLAITDIAAIAAAPTFPFCALHGQPQLQTALLLATVDPLIGGVLVEGPRGTAKSTSARALAALLPAGRFVNMPLGTNEEQLVGALDLEVALQDGRVRLRPGLLAQAHDGVLYIDEVNLLADGLVDLLLDVCASGINRIERDGISHEHAARITLIGTMNPEEGELRPQLLDRFGLFVSLREVVDAAARKAIVRTRLAFDADPAAFARRFDAQQQQLAARIVKARSAFGDIAFSDSAHDRVAALCHAAQVEGVRADLVMLRAARAHAALDGRSQITDTDIDAVAELVLGHRRKAAGDAPPPPSSHSTKPDNDPATDAKARPPQQRTATSDSAPDGSAGEGKENGEEDTDWGALPPPPVSILAVKNVRPLHAKKP